MHFIYHVVFMVNVFPHNNKLIYLIRSVHVDQSLKQAFARWGLSTLEFKVWNFCERKWNWNNNYIQLRFPAFVSITAFKIFSDFQSPSFLFTEEFQDDFLKEYHKVFDKLRPEFLVGEMVWNFADFMTVQGKIKFNGINRNWNIFFRWTTYL